MVLVGVTGYGTAMLFLLHGAPDLALTQVLVETVTLVVFVLVLRRLPAYFTDRPLTPRRYLRMALGAPGRGRRRRVMLVATGARTADAGLRGLPRGGGRLRRRPQHRQRDPGRHPGLGHDGRDLGARRGRDRGRQPDLPRHPHGRRSAGSRRPAAGPGRRARRPVRDGRCGCPAGATLAPERRSIIFEVVTRLVFHTIVVFSIYLLFAGHNNPGGGFAAGLVTGLALVVRYLAGGRYELDEAAPVDAGVLMGTGLFIAAASGLAPLAFGGAVLQSAVVDLDLPLLGDVHLVTSLFFDIGVYLVVVGLVLDLLRSLGSGIDRHILREAAPDAPTDRRQEVPRVTANLA